MEFMYTIMPLAICEFKKESGAKGFVDKQRDHVCQRD